MFGLFMTIRRNVVHSLLGIALFIVAITCFFSGDMALGQEKPGGAILADSAITTPLLADKLERMVSRDVIGSWTANVGRAALMLELSVTGDYVMGDEKGSYDVLAPTKISMKTDSGVAVIYSMQLNGDKLVLSGHDLDKPLEFARAVGTGGYMSRLFNFSGSNARRTLGRISIVLSVVIVFRIFISLLKLLSKIVIYSEWGPMKLFYRQRKNRAMTLHLLLLNVIKYVMYLLAVGFILTELGVNYAAYLASVSVIGLAIAFGAQGLVQDMVTGLLIIIEGQFDVGDMVDIPPHTGVVQELGLRMTRLRNYLGQQVVIPNRAISSVSNYRKGSQEAFVDLSVDADIADKVARIVYSRAVDISEQFGGIVLRKPAKPEKIELPGGDFLVRLRVSIWPSQQWVIDAQLVPVLRAALKAEELALTDDRIAVFYHQVLDRSVPGLGDFFKKITLGKG